MPLVWRLNFVMKTALNDFKSHNGRPIELKKISGGQNGILIIGGVHGDEVEGINVCSDLIRKLSNATDSPKIPVSIISCLNPDGAAANQRSNANDVDLNRNLSTTNWRQDPTNPRYKPGPHAASEPETQHFLEFVSQLKPKLIISVHSFTESLLLSPSNDVNAPLKDAVAEMAVALNIPVVDKMNYEIFGSLSRWGFENDIMVLTIELLRNAPDSAQETRFADEILKLTLKL